MDNAISQILDACKLARDIEGNLPNLASHPSALKSSCEDVVRVFSNAIHELDTQQQILSGGGQGIQAMDFFGPKAIEEDNPFYGQGFGIGSSSFSTGQDVVDSDMQFLGGSGGGEQMAAAARATAVAVEGSSSGFGRRPSTGSTGQRQSRKRKDSRGMRTVRVPAVRNGNMENPPDDGYTWRKYGQKDILGSRFPRSYFRCTHKAFYGCNAKKQVQRLDEDPYAYEVIYCGDHTCQTSTTPLILPNLTVNNPQAEAGAEPGTTQPSSSSLSTSIRLGSSWFDFGQRDFPSHGDGESSGAALVSSSECPVADLADVMFNSGSSGSSMDAIFSLRNESWKDKAE